jgi:hypothetical protein
VAEEGEAGGAGGAGAVLGDDDLGGASVGGVGVVELVSVEEHDDVGVLFEGPGFAEVGQHGAFVGPGFQRSGELGESDDGDVEFAGELLEAPSYLGYFELAGLVGCVGGHQLQVVDDD